MTEFARFATTLADTARALTRQYFRRPLTIDEKGDESPVTLADRQTEQALRGLIEQRYPEHGIYGEEFGEQNTVARYLWVLDPIDGTRSFITGTPLFGTLVALLEEGRPILGLIDMPACAERWLGGSAIATTWNGAPCKVSTCCELRGCRMACTSPEMFTGDELPRFQRLLQSKPFHRYGGDCYNYGLLASGHLDLVVEADLKPYDFCALPPIIDNAGGLISDWCGKPLTMQSGGQVVAAATPELHRQALEVLRQ